MTLSYSLNYWADNNKLNWNKSNNLIQHGNLSQFNKFENESCKI
jgi:hypothetical protein